MYIGLPRLDTAVRDARGVLSSTLALAFFALAGAAGFFGSLVSGSSLALVLGFLSAGVSASEAFGDVDSLSTLRLMVRAFEGDSFFTSFAFEVILAARVGWSSSSL
jgi:hypothetical protein